MLAVVAINKRTGKVERAPELIVRGFGGADISEDASAVVIKTLEGLTTEEKSDYGMVKEKVEPCPSSESTQIRPPCESMTWREIDNPSPVPPRPRTRARSTL